MGVYFIKFAWKGQIISKEATLAHAQRKDMAALSCVVSSLWKKEGQILIRILIYCDNMALSFGFIAL